MAKKTWWNKKVSRQFDDNHSDCVNIVFQLNEVATDFMITPNQLLGWQVLIMMKQVINQQI